MDLKTLFKNRAGVKSAPKIENGPDGGVTVYVYEPIGGWYGIEASEFVKALAGIDAEVIHLRVNSPGGDVFDARAMQTAIRQHSARVVAHVDGLAASAAAFLVMGADEIEMADGAFLMIHKAWTVMPGNADELREMAGMLDKVDAGIAADFSGRTGLDAAEITDMLKAETWLTAAEALEKGFIDRIFTGQTAENHFDLSAYKNTPEKLLKQESPAPKYDRAAIERRLSFAERTAR